MVRTWWVWAVRAAMGQPWTAATAAMPSIRSASELTWSGCSWVVAVLMGVPVKPIASRNKVAASVSCAALAGLVGSWTQILAAK